MLVVVTHLLLSARHATSACLCSMLAGIKEAHFLGPNHLAKNVRLSIKPEQQGKSQLNGWEESEL